MGTIYLSASEAESYRYCPWMTYLQKECDYKPTPTLENTVGIACHNFVAGLHKPPTDRLGNLLRKEPKYTPHEMEKQWVQHWIEHLRHLKHEVSSGILNEFLVGGFKLGPTYIKRYIRTPRVMGISPDKVEVTLVGGRIEGTSVCLSARVDQLRQSREDDGDLIIDLKFSRTNRFDIRSNFALKCYSLLYRQIFERKESGVGIWNVPFETKGFSYGQYSDEEIQETRRELGRIGRAIARRSWNLPNSGLCSSCPATPICTNPGKSVELQKLARRNSGFEGALPRTRSALLRERVLEPKVKRSSPQADLFENPDQGEGPHLA